MSAQAMGGHDEAEDAVEGGGHTRQRADEQIELRESDLSDLSDLAAPVVADSEPEDAMEQRELARLRAQEQIELREEAF